MKTRNAVTRIAVSGPLLDELVFQREEVSRFVLRTNLQSGSSESVQCHERVLCCVALAQEKIRIQSMVFTESVLLWHHHKVEK